ncbi:MAG TPA: vitamin K epoxide reductase family protein [Candidatus Gracilibacteria bacterium]|nr:vitamin K epoxide reductase family protein [Candidatus Gracilibacteria bacterium]
MITQKINKLLKGVVVLSFLGILTASYLTYLHYQPEASEFCNFGEQFNCEVVNKSQWSYIDLGLFDLPVSILGLSAYVFFFIVSLLVVKGFRFQKIHKWLRPGNMLKLMQYLSVVGLIFSLYLTYIEAFVLQTWCIFCVTSQIIMILITILFFAMQNVINKNKKEAKACEFC